VGGPDARNRPGELAPIIRRKGDDIEMVELVWGLPPQDSAGQRPLINIRSEGRRFPSHRALVPASEFFLRDRSGARWRFTLSDGDNFYFAAIWRPASDDWPEAYAVLRTAAGPDVEPCHDRQLAVIPRRRGWHGWTTPRPKRSCSSPVGCFRQIRRSSSGRSIPSTGLRGTGL
jgi:putative SOS response-associated peptidase YedK